MGEGVGFPSETGHDELRENSNRMLGLFLMGQSREMEITAIRHTEAGQGSCISLS